MALTKFNEYFMSGLVVMLIFLLIGQITQIFSLIGSDKTFSFQRFIIR